MPRISPVAAAITLALMAGLATATPAIADDTTHPAAEAYASNIPVSANAELVKAQILRATNNEREKAGLKPVLASPKLDEAAQHWAETYSKHGYKHNPDYLGDAGGWDYGWANGMSENIHLTFDGLEGVKDWMASPGHRANLMAKDANRIGIGVYDAGDGLYFMVQNFSTAGSGKSKDTSSTLYTKTTDAHSPSGSITSITVPKDGTIAFRGKATDPDAPGKPLTISYALEGNWATTKTDSKGNFTATIGPWAAKDGYTVQVHAGNIGAGQRAMLWHGSATNVKAHASRNNPNAVGRVPGAYDAPKPTKPSKPSKPGASVPVHRFWSPKFDNAHFYTSSTAEADGIRKTDKNWTYEGTSFRVWQANGSSCAAGQVPVYRFYSSAFASHFYTVSKPEADAIRKTDKNWADEGVAFCETQKKDGNQPVYRFWSPTYKKHFYTTNTSEMKTLRDKDPAWNYEGVAWYAPTK